MQSMSSPSPSANMEGAKDEEKSDVYSTNMTEAMGAGKLNSYVILSELNTKWPFEFCPVTSFGSL